jgi:hypothetical protein
VGIVNPETQLTLDDAVAEVLGLLTGLDLTYEPELDRYRAITRQLNRALRTNALENEWSFYSSLLALGNVTEGEREVALPINSRPRIVNDDAVRFTDADGRVQVWAYFLPRDALHKYEDRIGLWCSATRQSLVFSRPFFKAESGLEVLVPVMREPRMFRLPPTGKDVSNTIRKQLIDFPYPDVIVSRAAYYYASTDPVMQPRAQTLEEGYKNLMYQLIERDVAITDTPYQNSFTLPLENGLVPVGTYHRHPHSDFD